MTRPLVSVIVPTYRRPALLRRALASITSQRADGFALEVRVYDNASGDDTDAVARAAATDRVAVHYIQRPHNIGFVRNFTGAIRDVRADFFAIVSDDDVLLPGALQRTMSALLAHPEAAAWNGLVLSGSQDTMIERGPAPQWPRGVADLATTLDLISRNIRPVTTGMVFRSTVIDEEFCVDDDTILTQDLIWLCRAAVRGGIGVSPEPSALLCVHPGSLSQRGGIAHTVSVLFPSIPAVCDRLRTWGLPEPLTSRVVRQLLDLYCVHGLTQLGYQAVLAGDADGLAAVERTIAAYDWLAPVGPRVAWARRAPRSRVRLAMMLAQLLRGNLRHRLAVLWWNLFRWKRYRTYLRTDDSAGL